MTNAHEWPELPLDPWQDTYATLHLWTQIVGKVRLMQTPWVNHSWHVTLYPSARGLTTSPIPHGSRLFQIDFDFVDHRLNISVDSGDVRSLRLRPQPVAAFYAALMSALRDLNLPVHINPRPCELVEWIPFDSDGLHVSYDAQAAHRWWRILLQSSRVFQHFRSRFIGKCSPVHFFWGGFDLAVSRFSGRTAPPHPGGVPNLPKWVTREAYSHEVSSCGFWPGGGPTPFPLFYSYAYPEPPGFPECVIPGAGYYEPALREFILPYAEVRGATDPQQRLFEFLHATYAAAADRGQWNRKVLEADLPPRGAAQV